MREALSQALRRGLYEPQAFEQVLHAIGEAPGEAAQVMMSAEPFLLRAFEDYIKHRHVSPATRNQELSLELDAFLDLSSPRVDKNALEFLCLPRVFRLLLEKLVLFENFEKPEQISFCQAVFQLSKSADSDQHRAFKRSFNAMQILAASCAFSKESVKQDWLRELCRHSEMIVDRLLWFLEHPERVNLFHVCTIFEKLLVQSFFTKCIEARMEQFIQAIVCLVSEPAISYLVRECFVVLDPDYSAKLMIEMVSTLCSEDAQYSQAFYLVSLMESIEYQVKSAECLSKILSQPIQLLLTRSSKKIDTKLDVFCCKCLCVLLKAVDSLGFIDNNQLVQANVTKLLQMCISKELSCFSCHVFLLTTENVMKKSNESLKVGINRDINLEFPPVLLQIARLYQNNSLILSTILRILFLPLFSSQEIARSLEQSDLLESLSGKFHSGSELSVFVETIFRSVSSVFNQGKTPVKLMLR
jgi:hypothetical protein